MRRFTPPYKKDIFLNILFNILASLSSAFSFVMIAPVLNILFGIDKEVTQLPDIEYNYVTLQKILAYYVTLLKGNYGIEMALLLVGGFYVLATLLKVGTTYMASYFLIYVRNGIVKDIRTQLYKKILELPLSFFSEERKGDVMARITGDVSEVENSVVSSLDMIFKNPFMIIVPLYVMIMMNWQLTIFVLLLLPFSAFIIARIGSTLKRSSMKGQNKMGEILSTLEETLSGLRIIKAFNAEKNMSNKFGDETSDYKRIMNGLMRRRNLAHPISELLGSITIVLLLWYGGHIILTGDSYFQATDFISYLGLFYSIIPPAKGLASASYSIQKGLASMERIDIILDAKNEIKEEKKPHEFEGFDKEIKFSNVSFAYKDDNDVLKHIYVSVKKGETVALVGQSGAGKTTFVDLLPRFYDVCGGRITIDGTDIRDASIYSLRHLMGNVNQDPILFNDSFFNNIAFGIENATQEDVEKAAKIANAHDFIIATESGYQTNIGDRGGKLSGGQRQRISIARAVLKNPPIMILDEATSALDTESEKYVQDALDNLMKNRTSIVIAHRLSTIRKADTILVFKDGNIVERGKHEELLAIENGEYKKLHLMQNKD